MYAPGHVGIALALFSPVGLYLHRRGQTRLAVAGSVAIAGATLLPDVDLFLPWMVHRGPTHTVWFAILAGVSMGTIGALGGGLRDRSARRALGVGAFGAGLGALAVLAHLAGDVITPMGIRPLAPLSDASHTFDLVYARDPTANVAFLAAGSVATLVQFGAAPGAEPIASVRSALGRTIRGVHRTVTVERRAARRGRDEPRRPTAGTIEAVGGASETDD